MKSVFKEFDRFLFKKFNSQYIKMLEDELSECDSFLDLGCGERSPLSNTKVRFNYSVGVDSFEQSLIENRKNKTYNEYLNLDIKDIEKKFEANSFDCIATFDVIEHISKSDGLELIDKMTKIAKKKIIIFTPNGFLPQEPFDGNIYQEHISGWEIEEMKDLGFRVYGVNGFKIFRKGYKTQIRWKPMWFWERISKLSQILSTRNPKWAFQILCIKDIR
ncbi:MAG: class I SAM-dependent methyltransferase [Bacteroidales bacterium]|nr:class I SAM-dependent methyltransferase [Bacteroidales bacterium]